MRRLVGRRLVARARANDRSRDGGAAAVEFALVLPVLALILFGIIDYGLYFSNTLSAQSGVQTAARQATIGSFTPCATAQTLPSDESAQVAELICMVKNNTGSITGKSFVDVMFPADPPNPPPPSQPDQPGWTSGQELIVCEVIDVEGLTGYVPLPRHNGQVTIRSKVVTQIETGNSMPDSGFAEALPAGWDWNWCH
jgi:hypothetical protein